MWQLSMHSSRRLRLPLLLKRGQLEGQPTTANLLQARRYQTSQTWLAADMRVGGEAGFASCRPADHKQLRQGLLLTKRWRTAQAMPVA